MSFTVEGMSSKEVSDKLINENIAAKHMNIGLFYLNTKKYLAAMKNNYIFFLLVLLSKFKHP